MYIPSLLRLPSSPCAQWLWTLWDPMDYSLSGSCPWNFPGKSNGSGLPFPPTGDLPDPGIKPTSLGSPALAGRFFTTAPPGKPIPPLWVITEH